MELNFNLKLKGRLKLSLTGNYIWLLQLFMRTHTQQWHMIYLYIHNPVHSNLESYETIVVWMTTIILILKIRIPFGMKLNHFSLNMSSKNKDFCSLDRPTHRVIPIITILLKLRRGFLPSLIFLHRFIRLVLGNYSKILAMTLYNSQCAPYRHSFFRTLVKLIKWNRDRM